MKHLAILTLLICLFSPKLTYAQAENSRAGDIAALEALFNATNGSNWSNDVGWSSSGMDLNQPIYGVNVETINGELRVTEIDLFENNLNGILPSEIGNLSKLTHLKVKRNYLKGEIPESIGNMVSLVWLSLSSGNTNDINLSKTAYNHPGKGVNATNKFTGFIPDVFHNMQNLELIEIRGSALSGSLPPSIGSCTNLRGIYLAENYTITGNIPVEWGNLSNLWHLDLRHNDITGAVPIEVAQGMTLLTFVWFEGNDMIGSIPEFVADNIILFYNSKQDTGFSGSFPSWILDGRNQNLNTFNLGGHNFTGELPSTIGGAEGWDYRHMTVFGVGSGGEGLTGPLPDWINGMTSMVQLQLQNNDLSGKLPTGIIDALQRIRLFYIPNNNFSGQLPSGTWGSAIFDIQFQGNDFSGEIPDSWSSLTNTNRPLRLDLSSNNLEGVIPEFLKDVGTQGGGSLDLLSVQNNKFTPKDILPYRTELENTANTYNYLPQNTFGKKETLSEDSIIDRSSFHYTGNQYQWYRNGVELSGETSYTLDTSSYGTATYVLEIIHPDIDFIFESEPIIVTEQEGDGSTGSGGSSLSSPDLNSPKDGATGISLSPTLQWENLDVDYYELNLEAKTEESLIVDAEVDGNSYSVKSSESLNPETVYKWRVRGVKDGVEGEWSIVAEFTTQSENGGTENNGKGPQKSTPAKGDDKVSKKPTFKWNKVEEAETYELEVTDAETQELLVDEIVADTTYTPGKEFQPNHKYQWRVRAIANGELGEWGDTWEFMTAEELAFEVEVDQNYPNPFNPSTNIRFTLAEQQEISLKVYDMTGRLVATLINSEMLGGGPHSARFDAGNLASGIYFYRIITPGEIVTRKMTLMK